MPTVLLNAMVALVGLGFGYLISRYQNRVLLRTARQMLRPFEAISLRDEFHMAHILANQVRGESFFPDMIVAITPGGSMIGEWFSRRFLGDKARPIPMCSLWMHVERDSEGRHLTPPEACPFAPPSPSEVEKVLIVNDISRTGRTLEKAAESVQTMFANSQIKTAVLFLSQDAGPPYPNFCVDRPTRRIDFEWKK